MVQDGKYDVLNVTRALYVNEVHANSITLHDTTFRGNIHTSGRKVKELYENQKNTNCFTDQHKRKVEDMSGTMVVEDTHVEFVKPVFFKLPHAATVVDEMIPNNSGCMCLDDDQNIIYKVKKDNEVGYVSLDFHQPKVKVDIHDSVLHIESS